ncbi:MAG TPA: ABC transporter ATP-binding protein [Acidimicrobiales bacterium]|nr:ABC transporter ATP-binding protein [Acidimicrobiales bacterium]
MALLEARGVRVRFGGLQAVDDVSLDVEAGTIVGLIGPNGAGKTTTFNALSGVQACSGKVVLDGADVSHEPVHKRATRGMARTFQRLEVFGSMSAFDNIRTAAEIAGRAQRRGIGEAAATAREIVDRLGLVPVADRRADALPTGQGRLVELGRALATRPKIVLLDEPASGLNESETERLSTVLEAVRDDGIGVLLVEHDMDLVMQLCSTIYALNFGTVIASGTPAQIRKDPAVQDAYLGSAV